jgi:hypothetical protein
MKIRGVCGQAFPTIYLGGAAFEGVSAFKAHVNSV